MSCPGCCNFSRVFNVSIVNLESLYVSVQWGQLCMFSHFSHVKYVQVPGLGWCNFFKVLNVEVWDLFSLKFSQSTSFCQGNRSQMSCPGCCNFSRVFNVSIVNLESLYVSVQWGQLCMFSHLSHVEQCQVPWLGYCNFFSVFYVIQVEVWDLHSLKLSQPPGFCRCNRSQMSWPSWSHFCCVLNVSIGNLSSLYISVHRG